jgi:hypothetical protein
MIPLLPNIQITLFNQLLPTLNLTLIMQESFKDPLPLYLLNQSLNPYQLFNQFHLPLPIHLFNLQPLLQLSLPQSLVKSLLIHIITIVKVYLVVDYVLHHLIVVGVLAVINVYLETKLLVLVLILVLLLGPLMLVCVEELQDK